MKSSLRLDIPVPCHEDWAKMLPEEKGRHCKQCCKTVVDFTDMSDQEIVRYFQEKAQGGGGGGKGSAGTCGRFMAEQLGRDLAPAQIQRNGLKGWPLVVAGALTLGEGLHVGRQVTMGKAATPGTPVAARLISGMDVDTSRLEDVVAGKVVPEIVRDSMQTGKFPPPDTAVTEMGDVAIIGKVRGDSAMENARDTVPALVRVLKEATPGENEDSGQISIMGEPAVCTRNSTDTLSRLKFVVDSTISLVKDTVAVVVRSFKADATGRAACLHVYPNPVMRGGMLRLLWGGDAGVYPVAIFNMQGQIVQERIVEVGTRGQLDEWPLPGGLAAGVYFVRAVHQDGEAVTVKVVVQ